MAIFLKGLFAPDTNPGLPAAAIGTWSYIGDPLKTVSGLAGLASGTLGAAIGLAPAPGDVFGETWIGASPTGVDIIYIVLCFTGASGYLILIENGVVGIIRLDAGTPTPMASAVASYAPGDKLTWSYIYTTGVITVYKNGVAIPGATATDLTYKNGLTHGVQFQGPSVALSASFTVSDSSVAAQPTPFQTEYINLLIKQYWNKDNARAEIALQAAGWEKVRNFLASFEDAFDLDQATGAQLNIIGKWVGLSRICPIDVPVSMQGATPSQLSDSAYRSLLKVKIAKNNAAGFMASDGRISIQEVVQRAFDGKAFVLDNLNMSLTLYIDPTIVELAQFVRGLGLLPKPGTVRYAAIVSALTTGFFGFDDNPDALGFGDESNSLGGVFGEMV